ncbi:MAG: DUF2007 domain-containing protein [Geminicoccaceae bacterium]|nr:MAG: DUF2007 domain-containing protein [Geminicoccaceae bacterium]
MLELLRSNDLVYLSWACATLEAAGIQVLVLDQHTSAIEGSIGAIPRRLMVASDDWSRARWVLETAVVEPEHGG